MKEKLTPREEKVAVYLKRNCVGRCNAIQSCALETALHMSGNDLRNVVNRLRRKAVPIASGRCGYYYAATAGEVYMTIQQLQTMDKGLLAAIHGLILSMDDFGGGDAFG